MSYLQAPIPKVKKKSKKWYAYLFKRAQGFDCNDPVVPPVVVEPIQYILKNGIFIAFKYSLYCEPILSFK
jgi:hypothetical protein